MRPERTFHRITQRQHRACEGGDVHTSSRQRSSIAASVTSTAGCRRLSSTPSDSPGRCADSCAGTAPSRTAAQASRS
ncbi:hypothetical protein ACFQ0O_15350 [Saccharopolyspora spinosporotrichia]